MEGPLRQLIPLFLLAMWVVFYLLLRYSLIGESLFYLLLISHLICLLVFVNFVYVFNYGYALCMFSLSAISLILFEPLLPVVLVMVLAMLYGLRLLFFTHIRMRSVSYEATQELIKEADKTMPGFVKVLLWVFVSWNQLFYFLPIYFMAGKQEFSGWIYPGLLLMSSGLVLEMLADAQKQGFKKLNPESFCNSGLYRFCRHPNYLGEIVFIVGLYISAASSFSVWYEYLCAIISPLYLILLMLDAARRADIKQSSAYAHTSAYSEYARRVPSLWPSL